MKRILLLVALVAALTFGSAATAYAHCCTSNSVNSERDIPWKDGSKYDIGTPVQAWQNLYCYTSSCRGVNFWCWCGNGVWPLALVYTDFSKNVNYDGVYRPALNPDQIQLNRYYLDSESTSYVRSIIKHETGHALSFAHPPSTNYYRYNSIMYPGGTLITYIGPHDKNDYYARWR